MLIKDYKQIEKLARAVSELNTSDEDISKVMDIIIRHVSTWASK